MRYLVTGGTGFLGGALVRQLVAAGHEVRALVRARDRATALASLGVTKVVHTSTLAVFGDTHGAVVDESYQYEGPFISEYDRTKWLAHHTALGLAREGMPIVLVQPGLIYGPADNGPMRPLWDLYLRRRLPVVPSETAFCWGHVEDTARGHLLAMERGRNAESYIIAGPQHTLADAFAIASRVTGIQPPRPIPAAILRGAASVLDLVGLDAEALRVLGGATYLGTSAKAEAELGFTARSLEEGLGETLPGEIGNARPARTGAG